MSFTLFQLTNQTKDIFHLQFPIFKIPRLLTAGNHVKTISQSDKLNFLAFGLETTRLETKQAIQRQKKTNFDTSQKKSHDEGQKFTIRIGELTFLGFFMNFELECIF